MTANTTDDAIAETNTAADPRRWKTLAATIAAVLTVVLDGALLGLIAPSVAKDLSADAATIGLISSISMLMLAAFILGGGTLGDIYGRKRVLMIGLVGVTITSTLACLAPGASLLIPVRALAGIMAALVNPLALAIVTVTFDDKERPKALGLYFAAVGIVGGLGTIGISFLNHTFGWRSTFVLVGVFAVLSLGLIRAFVKESRAEGNKSLDVPGIALTAIGLFGLVYGINQAGKFGFFAPNVWMPVLVGMVVLAILVVYSRRRKAPALQLVLFKKKEFSVGVLIFLFMGFASMGSYFQLSTYLQVLQRVSPIQAALTLLPYTLSMFVFAVLSGGWVGKDRNRWLIVGGLAAMTVGLIAMGLLLHPEAGFAAYLIPLVLLGGGYSLCNTPRVSVVLGTAPQELAGAASATNNAAVQLGTSLGIAAMGALFQGVARGSYFESLAALGVDAERIDKSVKVLSAWLKQNSGDVAAQFGITARQLGIVIEHYEGAYTHGVTFVLWVAAGLIAAGAGAAWFAFGPGKRGTKGE